MHRLLASLLCLIVLPLALADAAGKPTITSAPATASVGDAVTVGAKNLKRGRYSLRIYANRAPNKDWACAATLATAKKAGTSATLTGTIPKRMGCWSGYPSSKEATIKVRPGKYTFVISVPNGPITTAAGSSVAKRVVQIG